MRSPRHFPATVTHPVENPAGVHIDRVVGDPELNSHFTSGESFHDVAFETVPCQGRCLSAYDLHGPRQYDPLLLECEVDLCSGGGLGDRVITKSDWSASPDPVDRRCLDDLPQQAAKASSLRSIMKRGQHSAQDHPDVLHDVVLIIRALTLRSSVVIEDMRVLGRERLPAGRIVLRAKTKKERGTSLRHRVNSCEVPSV